MIDLRAEREQKGLSLEEVSASARIPARYLIALEEGDHDVLPAGPFRRGYQRQYLEFLGFDPDTDVVDPTAAPEEEPEPERTETGTLTHALEEAPLGRLLVAGFVLTMTLVLGLRVVAEMVRSPESQAAATFDEPPEEEARTEAPPPDALPTARLRIRAVESTRLKTRVDGVESYSGTLPAREVIDLEGRQRIEVWAADLTTILITYNGERIEPLGNLSEGRRLVFIQD